MKLYSALWVAFMLSCTIMAACQSENLEAYKEKMLEATAKKLGTTKELLVKDLDIVIDSMSVVPFTVKDSLNLLKDIDQKIEQTSKDLESAKKAIEYTKKRSLFPSFYTIEKLEKQKEELMNKLERLKYLQDVQIPKYESMKESKVIAKIFCVRIAAKGPLDRIHTTKSSVFIFSADGETFIDEGSNLMLKYVSEKAKK